MYKIPKEMMSFTDVNQVLHVFNRFKWVDERTFLIVNEEGMEKLIDIDDGFKELAFNYRPLFTSIDKNKNEGREYESY